MDLSVAAVQELLATAKKVVRPMSWSPRLGKANPCWFRYETALENEDGIVLEEVRIIAQWSPGAHEIPESHQIGFFLGGARVYAIDVMPLSKHTNNGAGRGRPKYGQRISGIHEHTWSDDGYGYAEDINVEGIADLATAWGEFLHRANVEYPYVFAHPDPAERAGQPPLSGL